MSAGHPWSCDPNAMAIGIGNALYFGSLDVQRAYAAMIGTWPESCIKPGDDALPSADSTPLQFCSSCYRSLSGQPGSILICRPCADAGQIPRWVRP